MTQSELEFVIRSFAKMDDRVARQVQGFQQKFTNKEIARAVIYQFDVKKLPLSSVDTYGIGFVPFVVQTANTYYNNLAAQREVVLKSIKNYTPPKVMVVNKSPKRKDREQRYDYIQ